MPRAQHPLRQLLFLLVVVGGTLGLSLAVSEPVWTDDRDFLRFDTGNAYLFILLDTSESMSEPFGAANDRTIGFADDPESKLSAAKESLFDVFELVDDVNFGLATFQQNRPRALYRHWLYYLETAVSKPAGWPGNVTWPRPDPDGLTTFLIDRDGPDANSTPDHADPFPDGDVEGDAQVFGRRIEDSGGSPIPSSTCAAPLDLRDADQRRKANGFPKLGENGNDTTILWVRTSNSDTFRVRFIRNPAGPQIGQDNVQVEVRIAPVVSCLLPILDSIETVTAAVFRLDDNLNQFLMMDRNIDCKASGNVATECTANLWPWQDAKVDVGSDGTTCTNTHPHSGRGWEGNYDDGVDIPDFDWTEEGLDKDTFCAGTNDQTVCRSTRADAANIKAMAQTSLSGFGRALDRGDVLPFDWQNDNKFDFLQRLAPNWPEEAPNFGVAYHLTAGPDPASGVLEPRLPSRPPIIAAGDTPLGDAMLDFRCWYMGKNGDSNGGKCGETAFFTEGQGWADRACKNDSEFPCRSPFLIVISDGEDSCQGANPGSETAEMHNKVGVFTWALNLGAPGSCNKFNDIVNPQGECVEVANKQELKLILRDILGRIRERARAFASAAVPSVQATADQLVALTNFTPFNDESVWDGHLHAFIKDVPTTPDGKPDTTIACNPPSRTRNCHLWDAGAVMKNQQNATPADPIGTGAGQRRVFYSMAPDAAGGEGGEMPRDLQPGSTPAGLLLPVDCSQAVASPNAPASLICKDLLQAFGIPFNPANQASMTTAQNQANAIITNTFTLKSHDIVNPDGSPGGTVNYLLGDIFHSNPSYVGSPPNTRYFVANLGADQDDSHPIEADDSQPGANRGYRAYFRRQEFRRKLVLAGSNDGMLHAWNAGVAADRTDPVSGKVTTRYDTGTGHEVWAYMPRLLMPEVKKLAQGNTQRYTVDGTPSIADVFIDPVHQGIGSSDPPQQSQRLWRTVVFGGLREGGSGYYALDITSPDPVTEHQIKRSGGSTTDGFLPTVTSNAVPTCLSPGDSACGPAPYPAPLFEWADTTNDQLLDTPSLGSSLPMDEDFNGLADHGDSWSRANIGLIRLCNGDDCTTDLVDRHVAIFGGGMDPDHKGFDPRVFPSNRQVTGNFLYMVDIETGKTLYKRQLCNPHILAQASYCVPAGSMAADPAAVDTNADGYIDRIYATTNAGFLFRVDIGANAAGEFPAVESQFALALGGAAFTVSRIRPFDGAGNPVWEPVGIFDANWDGANPTATPRPLYQRPTVIFSAKLGLFALAFGSGDRADLWEKGQPPGRFYVFVDDTAVPPSLTLPLTEASFFAIPSTDTCGMDDLLATRNHGQKGWFLALEQDEHIITDAFSISGVTFTSSFKGDLFVTDAESDCDPLTDPNCPRLPLGACGDPQWEADTNNRCTKGGTSNIFVLGTVNACGYIRPPVTGTPPPCPPGADCNPCPAGQNCRKTSVSGFVTSPYTEPGSAGTCAGKEAIGESLKSLFPPACKFANQTVDIKTIAADTSLQCIAPVPVCIVEANWKEF